MARAFAFLMDNDFNIRAIFDDFLTLEWKRSFFIPAGAFELQVNLNQFNSAEITKGTFIGVTDNPDRSVVDRVLRVEQIERELGEGGPEDELLSVTGRDVTGMLEERLALPPSGQEYDRQTDVAVETAMKHYVDNHAGPSAPANRQVPNLVIAADQARGELVSFDARFQSIAEILETMSRATLIGWEINFDFDNKEHVFDVIVGVDRTMNSATPVLFDIEYNTVLSQHHLSTDLERKSFAYVASKGEGLDRTIVETFVEVNEPTGFNRREVFVDAQDIEATRTDVLELKGNAALAETISEDVVEAETPHISQFQYRTDFDLGDIITVRNRKWSFTKDMRIIGVVNRIEAGEGSIRQVFELDHPFPTLKDKILAQFRAVEAGRRV